MIIDTELYELQTKFIIEQCGEDAANKANYGWFTDDDIVLTKVYGYGVISTDYATGETWWVER